MKFYRARKISSQQHGGGVGGIQRSALAGFYLYKIGTSLTEKGGVRFWSCSRVSGVVLMLDAFTSGPFHYLEYIWVWVAHQAKTWLPAVIYLKTQSPTVHKDEHMWRRRSEFSYQSMLIERWEKDLCRWNKQSLALVCKTSGIVHSFLSVGNWTFLVKIIIKSR